MKISAESETKSFDNSWSKESSDWQEIILIEENLTLDKSLDFVLSGREIKWWSKTLEHIIISEDEESSSFLYSLISVGKGNENQCEIYQLDGAETDENDDEEEKYKINDKDEDEENWIFDPPPFDLKEYKQSRNKWAQSEYITKHLNNMMKWLDKDEKLFETQFEWFEDEDFEDKRDEDSSSSSDNELQIEFTDFDEEKWI